MVEVRAVVRIPMLDRVIRTLKEASVPRITVTRVHAIGAGADPAAAKFSFDEGSAYADKAWVQVICSSDRSEECARLVASAARTGRQGDGIMSIHPIVAVVKIRTGARGLAALK
jgi:nitrogen regulatory protein PII